MLLIENATVYTPGGVIAAGAVLMTQSNGTGGNGRIQAVGPAADIPCPPGAARLDAGGQALVPGLIDLQLNGGWGDDFTADPASIWRAAARLPRYGVTAFLPTIITAPKQTVVQARAALRQPPAGFRGAQPLGLHVEGPFLNPAKKGAHNPAHLRLPTLADAADWSPEKGVRLVTLAPELPGSLALIEALAARGVVVSAGHSLATAAQAQAGFAAGVRYGTHLFNAMPALHHREPGLAGALLADPRVTVGLIPDGLHVHPLLVELVWRATDGAADAERHGRLNLVTDAMAALGMPPGVYRLGAFEVTVDGQEARLADGTLAGSTLALDGALRNLLAFTGCTLAAALPSVTSTPAALLGLAGQKGAIAPGADADLALLGPDLQVATTLVGGHVVYATA